MDLPWTAPSQSPLNGLAKRMVQTFKAGLKKIRAETLETRVCRFLFSYRIMPQTTTALSSADMMISRRLRSTFDLLLPYLEVKVQKKPLKHKEDHDKSADLQTFSVGDPVYARNYS